jgi:hypothetical protein
MSDEKKIVKAWAIACLGFVCLWGMQCQLVNGKQSNRVNSPSVSENVTSNSGCPADLKLLGDRMLKQLPSYANRVIQRSKSAIETRNSSVNVIVAGKPEFKPLKLSSSEYTPLFPETSKQIFFTTLERRFSSQKAIERNNYHWLLLTPTDNGWQMVMMFSQYGSPKQNNPPLPPQESTNGYIGQAVRIWLRDCHAGKAKGLI